MAGEAFALPEDPTAPERRLVEAAAKGEWCVFDADAPEAGRRIRAAVIVALLRGHATRLTALGLRVQWAVIAGPLDLAGLGSEEAPTPPLVLWNSTDPAPADRDAPPAGLDLDLTGAVLAELDLWGSWLARVEAPDLVLRRRLLLGGCRTPAHAALTFDGARIGSHVSLDGAIIAGEVRFLGAEIGGAFNARAGTEITSAKGKALSCDGMQVKRDVFLDGANIAGEVRFLGAEIGGTFSANRDTANGDTAKRNARITNASGAALNCYTAIIQGGVFLRGTVFAGSLKFREAEVGGLFDLGGATLEEAGGGAGPALDAVGLKLGGDLRLAASVDDAGPLAPATCTGALWLDRARIEGALILTGAALQPGPGDRHDIALSLEQARIETRIEVKDLRAATRGVIDLRGAHAGLLDDAGGAGWGEPCDPAQPVLRDGRLQGVQLRLEGFTYDRLPDFEDGGPEGSSRLRRAWAVLVHAKEQFWWRLGARRAKPTPPYPPGRAEKRLAFLMRRFPGGRPRAVHYAPQPFDQVVTVLRAAGYPQEADWFARQKRNFRRRCGVDGWLGWVWSQFTGLFFGHFFLPGRAILTLAGTVVLGMALLAWANAGGAYVKKRNEVDLSPATLAEVRLRAASAQDPPPPNREACWKRDAFAAHGWPWGGRQLEAAVMAFDLLLPLVDLKQDNRCEVDTDRDEHRPWSSILAIYSGLGLVILPMFLATVSGIVRREGDAKT